MLVVSPTITNGNISLIPKTAINMPIVRNNICQSLFQFLRIDALTTALSKESEISKTKSIKKIDNAWNNPD